MFKTEIMLLSRNILIAAMGLILLNSCDKTRHSTGWDYFPDMFYPLSYETYNANPVFADSMTMRTPVRGTVPLNFVPFDYTIDPKERVMAGNDLVNPLHHTADAIETGRKLYTTFCANCHGEKGAGDGYLFTSKLYPALPRSLVNETAINLKDGEIYHTITLGFGTMGPHGQQVRPAERWNIIVYIRSLQGQAQ